MHVYTHTHSHQDETVCFGMGSAKCTKIAETEKSTDVTWENSVEVEEQVDNTWAYETSGGCGVWGGAVVVAVVSAGWRGYCQCCIGYVP